MVAFQIVYIEHDDDYSFFVDEVQRLVDFIFVRKGCLKPMNGAEAAPRHSSEPGHLAFGKLVDGDSSWETISLVGEFCHDVKRQICIPVRNR